jgi:hypothetical protein
MALQRYTIDGYGQLELNAVAFRRSGRIEAQCALDARIEKDSEGAVTYKGYFADHPAENGMLLAVNNIDRVVMPVADGNIFPVALNYTTEHMYDERQKGLKHFCLNAGEHLPRMGYQGAGDKYTTNCLAYDTTEFANDEALEEAVNNVKTERLYAKACANGAHQITKKADGAVCLVLGATTMPDGQFAVKFQAL